MNGPLIELTLGHLLLHQDGGKWQLTTPRTAPYLFGASPRPLMTPPMEGLEEVT